MKENYEKISKLVHRDRITSSDINFIQSMHNLYCSQLKKNICWQCPASIREAINDLINYVKNNPIKDESEIIKEQRPTKIGGTSKQVPDASERKGRTTKSRR